MWSCLPEHVSHKNNRATLHHTHPPFEQVHALKTVLSPLKHMLRQLKKFCNEVAEAVLDIIQQFLLPKFNSLLITHCSQMANHGDNVGRASIRLVTKQEKEKNWNTIITFTPATKVNAHASMCLYSVNIIRALCIMN